MSRYIFGKSSRVSKEQEKYCRQIWSSSNSPYYPSEKSRQGFVKENVCLDQIVKSLYLLYLIASRVYLEPDWRNTNLIGFTFGLALQDWKDIRRTTSKVNETEYRHNQMTRDWSHSSQSINVWIRRYSSGNPVILQQGFTKQLSCSSSFSLRFSPRYHFLRVWMDECSWFSPKICHAHDVDLQRFSQQRKNVSERNLHTPVL